MDRPFHDPVWPRWFRWLCYGLIATIIVGMAYRTLEGEPSAHERLQGLGGIALLCLWVGYATLSKTRWRDRNRRSGLALLGCLAITVGLVAVLAPNSGWWNPQFALLLGGAVVFAFALIGSQYIDLSSRAFGVVVSLAGVTIAGFGLVSESGGSLGGSETVVIGTICLVIGLLLVFWPDKMERLEKQAREHSTSDDADPDDRN